MTSPARNEQRTQPRQRRSDAIAWRLNRADRPRSAWLLDSSVDGVAFAWRGASPPSVDTLIELCTNPERQSEVYQTARVRRVTKVHGDLMVLAAEVWRTSAFPPAASETVEAKAKLDIKPSLDLRPFDLDEVMSKANELRKNAWWRSGG